MAEHTPGPWSWDEEGRINAADDTAVAYVVEHGNVNTVARTGETFGHADARLIAAAPEMLAVLKRLAETWDAGATVGPGSYTADDVRAVVAAAEGRQLTAK